MEAKHCVLIKKIKVLSDVCLFYVCMYAYIYVFMHVAYIHVYCTMYMDSSGFSPADVSPPVDMSLVDVTSKWAHAHAWNQKANSRQQLTYDMNAQGLWTRLRSIDDRL